jgi:hypothetical protein
MDFPARGVEQKEALLCESLGVEIAKGLCKSVSGPVGGDESVHGVGGAEQFPGLIDQTRDGVIKFDPAHRPGSGGGRCVSELAEFAAGRKDDVVDLVEIVIFCGKPEHGGVRFSRGGGLAGAGNGGGGLEWREERAAEEANLLTCNDDARTGTQGFEGWSSGGRGILCG